MKMNLRKNTFNLHLWLVPFILFSQSLYGQSFDDGYYRLTTQWLGEVRSLDVINDGINNKLYLANTANASGQFWKITAVGSGYYRLTTRWLGESKSLDVINDGANNKLQLAGTSYAAGQFWKIADVGDGYYRLTTRWLGESKSLDVVNDGTNNKINLAETGNFSGQFWKITKVLSMPTNDDPVPGTTKNLKELSFSGFKIFVDENLANNGETIEALAILSVKLQMITNIVKPKHLEKLKKVPIYIQYKLKTDGAMWYHPNKFWLLGNGYPEVMAKSIEIKCIRNFIDWQGDQPLMVLHELAHAHQDLNLAELRQELTEAYANAVAGGKYENVAYVRGGKQRHYAMNNETEYFAELTEAYFGQNDYYPFNKKELSEFDPNGYKLMQKAWD